MLNQAAAVLNFLDFKDTLLLAAIFLPLERLLALRRTQKVLRRAWRLDVAHLFISANLIRLGMILFIATIAVVEQRFLPGLRAGVARQPLWLQIVEAVLVADLGFYAMHRAFHAIPFLWRFHAIHHSIEELDWLAAYRVHPVDQILTKGASLLPVLVLGFSLPAVAVFSLIYRWQSVLIHTNTRIAVGPLRWLIASPHFHHWHHANCEEALDKNFAGQLPIWDIVFGTLYLPLGRMPPRYGTQTPVPSDYVGQLAFPFRPSAEPGALMRASGPIQG